MDISISYDRVLSLEDKITTSLCDQYEQDGVVLPACFNKGLFTIGAIDNLDYNPSSTTLLNLHFMELESVSSNFQ